MLKCLGMALAEHEQQIFKLQYYLHCEWHFRKKKNVYQIFTGWFSCSFNTWICYFLSFFSLGKESKLTGHAGGYGVQHVVSSTRSSWHHAGSCWIIWKAKHFQGRDWPTYLVSLECCLQTIKFRGVRFTWFITVASYWLVVNGGSDSGRTSASWSRATEVAVNGSLFVSGQHRTPSMNNKIFVNHLCWLSCSLSN